MPARLLRSVLIVVLATVATAGLPRAEETKAQPKLTVSADLIVYLARNMLIGLNQANQTGNYTVLRQLCAAEFQNENSPEKLEKDFEPFRTRNIDLASTMVTTPRFAPPPKLARNGDLVLTGTFPTRPLEVRFALSFRRSGNIWICTSIGVSAEAPKPVAAGQPKLQEKKKPPHKKPPQKATPPRNAPPPAKDGAPPATTDY